MKFRESGMPEESIWETFFQPDELLKLMSVDPEVGTLMDIGCGYGTFLFPAAGIVRGKVIGVDIDDSMLKICHDHAIRGNFMNVDLISADMFLPLEEGGLRRFEGEIDYICLYNILHCESPDELLLKAYQLLKSGGRAGIIHWNYDKTPRGPSLEIRPTPDQIIVKARTVGFRLEKHVDLKPYHYGLVFIK